MNIGSFSRGLLFLSLVLLVSCGSNESDSDADPRAGTGRGSGVVTLSGDDTVFVGTQLTAGNVAFEKGIPRAEGNTFDRIRVVDQNSTVSFNDPGIIRDPGNPNNNFLLSVDISLRLLPSKLPNDIVSIRIVSNGVESNYMCSSVVTGCSVDSNLNPLHTGQPTQLDIDNKIVTFNDTTVFNEDTDKILTMNGTLTWE